MVKQVVASILALLLVVNLVARSRGGVSSKRFSFTLCENLCITFSQDTEHQRNFSCLKCLEKFCVRLNFLLLLVHWLLWLICALLWKRYEGSRTHSVCPLLSVMHQGCRGSIPGGRRLPGSPVWHGACR